jgi:hypothetical protein
MSNVNLSDLIQKKKTTLTAWAAFDDGFDVELEYTDPAETRKMLTASKENKWRRGKLVPEYNDDIYQEKIAKKVKNWRGLTIGKLAELVNIAADDMDPEIVVEFNQDNLAAAMSQIPGFAAFVSMQIMELAAFRKKKQDEEIKNSERLPASNSD